MVEVIKVNEFVCS